MVIFLLSLGLIGAAMLAMSVGVVLSGRCLRGSCGGPAATSPEAEPLACATCPNRRRDEGSLSRADAA